MPSTEIELAERIIPLPRLGGGTGLVLPVFDEAVPMSLSLYRETPGSADEDIEQFAQDLLSAGALRESDWCGNLTDTIRKGLHRFVNEDLGAKRLKILGGLRLEYTNDARAYFKHLYDEAWRKNIKAVEHRPVGFFSLSWTAPGGKLRPVYVAKRVEELNKAFPGSVFGYAVCTIIEYAGRWSCNIPGFLWGLEQAREAGEAAFLEWIRQSDLPATEEEMEAAVKHFEGLLSDELRTGEGTTLWHGRFLQTLPPGLAEGEYGIKEITEVYDAVNRAARASDRPYLRVVNLAYQLMLKVDQSGKTHIGAPHMGLFFTGSKRIIANGSAFLRWSKDDDMARVVDDHYHYHPPVGKTEITDICWLHGFQLMHAGQRSAAGDAHQRAADTRFPVPRGTIDAGGKRAYQYEADGSVAAAVRSLRHAIEICVLLDELLVWLDDPTPVRMDRDADTPEPMPRMWFGY